MDIERKEKEKKKNDIEIKLANLVVSLLHQQ